MHSRTPRASDQEKRAPARVPVSPEPDRGGPPVAPSRMTPAELLGLQGSIGNRAAGQVVQRAGGDQTEEGDPRHEQPVSDARGVLTRSLIGSAGQGPVTDHKIREALETRLKTGPPFDDEQLAAIRSGDPKWLETIGIGTHEAAEQYLAEGNYQEWSARKWIRWPLIKPGKRILIATLAWRNFRGVPGTQKLPSYTLGRALQIRSPHGLAEDELQAIIAERDEQIREAFVETLIPREMPVGGTEEEHRKVQRAQDILTKVFLILQNGLKIYREGAHVDLREGDVARALAHGGRVNIRIPELSEAGAPFDLSDWVGLTDRGKDVDASERRAIGTHRMDIGKNRGETPGKFEEKGGLLVGASNAAKFGLANTMKLPVDDSRTYGINPAAGGYGNLGVNDEVIRPDGGHGHMFLRFQPPKTDRDGAMQVGMETTAPRAPSPVGYRHDAFSTESTSNPETSFFGHKQDKIGEGKLNQQIVNLSELGGESGDWLNFLRDVEAYWNSLLVAAGANADQVRELYRQLVGPREDRFIPPSSGTGGPSTS